jgi:hypothetical protein
MIQIFINNEKYTLEEERRITGQHVRDLGHIDEVWDIYLKRGRAKERLIQDHMVFDPNSGDKFITRLRL